MKQQQNLQAFEVKTLRKWQCVRINQVDARIVEVEPIESTGKCSIQYLDLASNQERRITLGNDEFLRQPYEPEYLLNITSDSQGRKLLYLVRAQELLRKEIPLLADENDKSIAEQIQTDFYDGIESDIYVFQSQDRERVGGFLNKY